MGLTKILSKNKLDSHGHFEIPHNTSTFEKATRAISYSPNY